MAVVRWLSVWRRKSPLLLAGVLGLAVGGVLDVAFHLSPASLNPRPGSPKAAFEYTAHLITFSGMILTLLGILVPRPTTRKER